MRKSLKFVNLLVQTAGAAGSLFIKRTADGKYEIAIAPVMVAVVLGSTVTCAVQKDEPFRQCVESTITMFKEITHAN